MKKKIIAAVAAIALVLCCAVGGTLAWLKDNTDPVVNTFTYGDIDIDLKETTGDNYKMVPGNDIAKDPKVFVTANSEACWLFVKVDKNATYDTYLENYVIADGWKLLEGKTDVYYREVSAEDAQKGINYPVLKDNKVTVSANVTKEQMVSIKNGTTDKPTLTFTAYAVQKDNIASAAAAWEIINK